MSQVLDVTSGPVDVSGLTFSKTCILELVNGIVYVRDQSTNTAVAVAASNTDLQAFQRAVQGGNKLWNLG